MYYRKDMVSGRYREEVFNTLLALLLHQRGIVSAPEQSFRQALSERRRYPDVLVVYRGLRTVIEGKVDDTPNAEDLALQQAQERVDKGIAHIGVAVVYPSALRKVQFPDLENTLKQSTLRIATRSEAGGIGWVEGGLDQLADILRHTFDQMVKEDVVAKALAVLNEGVNKFAIWAFTAPAMRKRAADILGVKVPPESTRKRTDEEEE